MTTKSIYINHLRAAVEQYVDTNPEGPQIVTIPSHIGDDFRAYGYAESEDAGAIAAIERIADQMAVGA